MPDKAITILVIDDEESVLSLIAIVLESRGYKVVKAKDAVAGLRIVDELKPPLVLLDYMMPKVDGMTALRRIRETHPDTYVIMLTGKGNEEVAVELMKAGASDYVTKPFNVHKLHERIESVLKVRSAEIHNRALLQDREQLMAEIKVWNSELEQRVQKEAEALQKAHLEIVQSQKLATLGYLAAGMAHEIRNPLNSIALFVQLVREGLDDPEKLEYVERILKEVERVDHTLRNLLDTAKRPMFELKEVNIDQIVRETLAVFQPQTKVHRIEVSFDIKKTPPPIKADSSELVQIFTNLFLNAIHEMAEGGKLAIELDYDTTNAIIHVSDTGKGIPRENLPSIFDPFFTTKSKGTGMGLSVVLRIVKNYRGAIEVAKSDSSGTTFRISIPL